MDRIPRTFEEIVRVLPDTLNYRVPDYSKIRLSNVGAEQGGVYQCLFISHVDVDRPSVGEYINKYLDNSWVAFDSGCMKLKGIIRLV